MSRSYAYMSTEHQQQIKVNNFYLAVENDGTVIMRDLIIDNDDDDASS